LKKRSARLEEPFTYFVDRCLGSKEVPSALSKAVTIGERVLVHDEYFRQDLPDVEWLSIVGKDGLIVLSGDQNITRNPLELSALLQSGVAFFGVSKGKASGAKLGALLVRALPLVRRCLRRSRPPLIATVTASGDVIVKWEAGEPLEPHRHLRAGKTGRA